MHVHKDTACAELVERITDFLDGTLDTTERVRLEQHLVFCEGCVSYVEQMQETTGMLSRAAEPAAEPVDVTALAADLLRRAGALGGGGR
jgi:anti-sigma factor RsiW